MEGHPEGKMLAPETISGEKPSVYWQSTFIIDSLAPRDACR